MKTLIVAGGLVAAGASAALAGGVDRSGQSLGSVLFEKGNYVEFSLGYAAPNVSGVSTVFSGSAGKASGNMSGSYLLPGFAFKKQITGNLDVALVYDQPFGASVEYPAGTGYFAQGATAKLSTNELTALLKYRFDNNVSVYGGPRWQTMRETAAVPFVGGYTARGENQGAFGYTVGAAYEIPSIAGRVALTYNSKIDYAIPTTEFGALVSTTNVTTPQSVNLDFQTGINPTTLLFGSVRWVNWKQFDITPVQYKSATNGGSLVSYAHNTVTFSVGLGHKFNDTWSGAVVLGFEPKTGGFASNLGPTDGRASIGLGVTYTHDNMKVTGGISYIHIGSTTTTLNGTNAASNFTGNHAIAVGVKVGYSF